MGRVLEAPRRWSARQDHARTDHQAGAAALHQRATAAGRCQHHTDSLRRTVTLTVISILYKLLLFYYMFSFIV